MTKLNLGAILICAVTILMVGCKSSPGSASPGSTSTPMGTVSGGGPQSGGKPGGATYVTASALPNQFTTATISDPSLNNMPSATLTIPAGWKLQGITMISACTFSPWPVFRAYSPDALMQMRIEPVVGWQWHPALKGTFNSGCANISGQISAAAFLQYYLGMMQGGVHVEGPMQVPPAYSQWAQGYAANANQNMRNAPPAMRNNNTADTAALRIEVVNGSFVVEERLRTVVECSIGNNASPSQTGGTCWARVDVLTAPLGELDALVQLVDNNNLPHGVNSPQWTQAALQRQQRQGQQAMAALDGSGTTGEQDDLSAVPADHAALRGRAPGVYAATGVTVRERDEQRECVDECPEPGYFGLGGLLAGPGNRDESRWKHNQGYGWLFGDLDQWNSVVPDRHSEFQSERSAGWKLVADDAGSGERDADELRMRVRRVKK